jgi:hypothetical protein
MERTMNDHVRNAAKYRLLGGAIDTVSDRPATTLAIVDGCYRVIRADGSLSGARACAASRQAASRGVIPRIPR